MLRFMGSQRVGHDQATELILPENYREAVSPDFTSFTVLVG